MNLKTPISQLGTKYKLYATRLKKLEIETLEDLLFHVPFRYEDRSAVSKIEDIKQGEIVTIQGKVESIKNTFTRKRGFTIQNAVISDDTDKITCTWFNQPYLTRVIKEGNKISITGSAESPKKFMVKDYEVLKENNKSIHTGRLVPQYPATKNISVKWIRGRIAELIPQVNSIDDPLPYEIIQSYNLFPLLEALQKVHFPKNLQEAENARKRLAFDELLMTQLATETQKKEWQKEEITTPFHIEKFREEIENFINSLPFELTNAQKRALEDLSKDLANTTPMNRMLQGDVGAGKTVIAAAGIYIAYLNGFQSALMAPTEILATQHYKTITDLLQPLGVKIAFATGNKKIGIKKESKAFAKSERVAGVEGIPTRAQFRQRRTSTDGRETPDRTRANIKEADNSNFDVIIGTHALLHKTVEFQNLAFLAFDEQQRFGVEQRATLRKKGNSPHVLTMTATPIPRTAFLTLYGELDHTYLDELPKGRKIIKTWVVPKAKREGAYNWIKEHIKKGKENNTPNQIFILCPFIEESESMATVKAAKKEYEILKSGPFKDYKVALLHGKMKAKEKEKILQDFRDGNYDILVSTPVVEVGIDIPNATIMVIEGADRFGLAQLHQLRGRVGRNNRQGYCLLFTENESDSSIKRLKFLENTHLGANLAEIDLKLRGPGDMYGTRQSGHRHFKIASLADAELISKARTAAKKLIEEIETHELLHNKLKSTIIHKISRD